jgi:hypothetical protein
VRTFIGEAVRVTLETYEITDDHPPAGPAEYWLQERSLDGSDNWYGPAHLPAAAAPAALRLDQNQPNPFNPRTTIRYSLPQRGHVRLVVYDLRGARITTLIDADLPAGEWKTEWDGHDARDRAVPSGVYIARLETTSGTRSVKMIVTK